MEDEKRKEKVCPGCGNACPADSLKCGRGRAYFGADAENDPKSDRGGHGFAEGDGVVRLLRKCGHLLHHVHGGSEVKLDCLTAEERAQLTFLLEKCLRNLEN